MSVLYSELSHEVIGACFAVQNYLGPGLAEKVYEEALVIGFNCLGIPVARQKYYPVYYKGQLAGSYLADLVVDEKIILELKSVTSLKQVMEAQLLNYMRLSKVPVGYLVNFYNEKVEYRRFVV